MNATQLKSLLLGPVGSSLEIEVLLPDGKVKAVNLLREAITNKPYMERQARLGENYDKRSGQNNNAAFVEDSLDIETRATQNLIMRAAYEWPEAERHFLSLPAFSAAIENYEVNADSDPKKSVYMNQMADMKSGMSARDNAKASAAERSDDQEQLKLKRSAALLAEHIHDPHATRYWLQLAFSEVHEDPTIALEDAHRAMSLYTKDDALNNDGILGCHSAIIGGLVCVGRKAEAEQLLIEAVDKTKALVGDNALDTRSQLVDLFIFYVNQKNEGSALKILEQVLSGNLTTGETLTESLNRSHCFVWPRPMDAMGLLGVIFKRLDVPSTKPEFRQTVLQKILAAQKLALKPEDERLVPTLAALGDANFQMEQYGLAEKYYDAAYEISARYHKGEFAVRQVGKNFIANLKKLGKTDYAAKLEDMEYEGVDKP